MNTPAFLSPLPLALNSEGDEGIVPEWIQLTPPGPALPGIDGRHWRMPDPEAVIATCRALRGGIEIPIDFEHATHVKGARGERADAAGWIRELTVRDGAIWGRVEWNRSGREAVASRGYRFISPGFDFAKATGQVRRILSAGLTNLPNFSLPALNRAASHPEETEMDPAVLEALGLKPDATAADAVVAITALRRETETALNRAQAPDPAQFVPRADYELATNRLAEMEQAETARAEAEIAAAVDVAVEAGKIAPVSREFHLAACRMEGGLEKFRAMISATPAFPARQEKKAAPAGAPALDEAEVAICRAFGTNPTDYAAFKAQQES